MTEDTPIHSPDRQPDDPDAALRSGMKVTRVRRPRNKTWTPDQVRGDAKWSRCDGASQIIRVALKKAAG